MRKLTGLFLLIFLFLSVSSCKPDSDISLKADNTGSNTPVSFSVGKTVMDILVTGNTIWAATSGGVVKCDLETGKTQKFTSGDGLGSNAAREIACDSRGNIWVICATSGISRFEGDEWAIFNVSNGLCSSDTISVTADEKSGVWVSSYWGVSYFDGQQWASYSNHDPDEPVIGGPNPMKDCRNLTIVDVELSAADVIFVDSRGDVWFSSRTQGVSRFDGEQWQQFLVEDGLAGAGVSAITEDKDGNLWFGSMGGITRFDGSQLQVFTIKEHQSIIPRPFIQDIKEDKQGNIWVAAYGGGVSCYDGTDWRFFTIADGLPSENARSINFDSEGKPVIITDNGVSRYDGTGWQTLTEEDGLPDGKIRSAFTDDEGRLWFGTEKGKIQRFD